MLYIYIYIYIYMSMDICGPHHCSLDLLDRVRLICFFAGGGAAAAGEGQDCDGGTWIHHTMEAASERRPVLV